MHTSVTDNFLVVFSSSARSGSPILFTFAAAGEIASTNFEGPAGSEKTCRGYKDLVSLSKKKKKKKLTDWEFRRMG